MRADQIHRRRPLGSRPHTSNLRHPPGLSTRRGPSAPGPGSHWTRGIFRTDRNSGERLGFNLCTARFDATIGNGPRVRPVRIAGAIEWRRSESERTGRVWETIATIRTVARAGGGGPGARPALGPSSWADTPAGEASEVVKASSNCGRPFARTCGAGRGCRDPPPRSPPDPRRTITPPDARRRRDRRHAGRRGWPPPGRPPLRGRATRVRASRLARRDGQAAQPEQLREFVRQKGKAACRPDRGPAEESGLRHQLGALLARRDLLTTRRNQTEPGRLPPLERWLAEQFAANRRGTRWRRTYDRHRSQR
jgi:hypothetical protein